MPLTWVWVSHLVFTTWPPTLSFVYKKPFILVLSTSILALMALIIFKDLIVDSSRSNSSSSCSSTKVESFTFFGQSLALCGPSQKKHLRVNLSLSYFVLFPFVKFGIYLNKSSLPWLSSLPLPVLPSLSFGDLDFSSFLNSIKDSTMKIAMTRY